MVRGKGWLHVIAGPMFSGKTDELIRHLRRQQVTGATIRVYRPITDNRSPELLSRSGARFPSVYVASAVEALDDIITNDPDVVAFDEAQFFDSLLVTLVGILTCDRTVFVSGLDTDFLGRPFGPMPELLALADEVTKLTALCCVCYDSASRTQRLVDGQPADIMGPTVLVGGMGDETYEARCRKHHEIGA